MKYLHFLLVSVLLTKSLIRGCNERIDLAVPKQSSTNGAHSANNPLAPKITKEGADKKVQYNSDKDAFTNTCSMTEDMRGSNSWWEASTKDNDNWYFSEIKLFAVDGQALWALDFLQVTVDGKQCGHFRSTASGAWNRVYLNGCYGKVLRVSQETANNQGQLIICGLQVFGTQEILKCKTQMIMKQLNHMDKDDGNFEVIMVEVTLILIAICSVGIMGYYAIYRKCPFFILGAEFAARPNDKQYELPDVEAQPKAPAGRQSVPVETLNDLSALPDEHQLEISDIDILPPTDLDTDYGTANLERMDKI